MAPGRKRGGAKGAKANKQLKLGDLVLAKVKGHPAWPAKISKPEDHEKVPDPRKYFVEFFGTAEIAFVAPVDIQPFTSESKNKLLNRCKGKTVKHFSQAVNEICGIFEEMRNKGADSLNDDHDRQSSQPDANSTEMVDDGMATDGPGGATSSEIVNHGTGLERCSHMQREMGYEDVKPSVLPVVDGCSPSAVSAKKRAEICNDVITSPKGETISSCATGHSTNLKYGDKAEMNGHNSKQIERSLKKRHDVDDGISKSHGPLGVSSASHTRYTKSTATKIAKDGTRRSSSNGTNIEATLGMESLESGGNIKKTKKVSKDKTHAGVDDLLKDVEGAPMELERNNVELTGRKSVLNDAVLHPAKRSKGSDDASKKSQAYRKNDTSSKGGNEDVMRSTPSLKTKNRFPSNVPTNGVDSGVTGDEDIQSPTKRRRRVLDTMPGSILMSDDRRTESSNTPRKGENNDSVKSGTHVPVKRRAVRIWDDDEDEPKTPVHGRSLISTTVEESGAVTEAVQNSPGVRNSRLHAKAILPNSQQDILEVTEGKVCYSPMKPESEKKSAETVRKMFVSPIKSPFNSYYQMAEPNIANKSLGKVSANASQKKIQTGPSKASSGIHDLGHRSQNNAVNERSRSVISGEKQKFTPKLSSRVTDNENVSRKPSDSNLLSSERAEFSRVDRATLLVDSKGADSNKSMRHLIAVAQAKRKKAQSQNVMLESISFSHVTTSETTGRSPRSISAAQPVSAGPGIVTSLSSPSSLVHQLASNDQTDVAEFEERRTSSGHRPAGGSLSGGTEAAVARDAFEGMIETLSRTKESIGRATRHAIDCAKHGIASEVVELLTRKLENEGSFNRRVDIFFLVDSITQCSHSQKGIAGASYIPAVQAALPRLLGAAAPPGANARENRRQCLKVLKLWLERKILPDTLLRSYVEDIGSSNDERAVDDPIRGMEGMLVDEYGSNATFQLPGLLSSNVFEEEEEDDDILNFSHKEGIGKSEFELNPGTGELETCSVTSNDRRHCILEDVDGELEMEDVSGHPKDEKALTGGSCKAVEEEEFCDRTMDAVSNSNKVSPLREGSPPLPPDSPPPTPPLPSSPEPPESPDVVPPPPSSPPPPPPPPLPPSQTYPHHPLNGVPPQISFSQPSIPPQTSSTPKLIHPYQSPMPSSVPLNARLGPLTDAAVRGEMFPQQPPSFVPALASSSREPSGFISSRTLEYGHEAYANPQGFHSNQQFQNASIPLPSRAFQPNMPSQSATSQFQYPNPAVLQHSYPPLYGLTKPPDGLRRYGADEQWRPPANEFGTDSQRGPWIGSGRTSGPSFAQEGYFRPPMERPPGNNVSYQPTGQSIVPAGAPIPGYSGSLMMPGRPDMSSLGSWRSG
uniref:ENHANCER OF AG-4 protein 2 isoform X2 n=1 Tax=Erigeron canadensis TaxID=72917 RepID=UPI001CB95D03|nr:ENHANCER OF AG-4 protein 2 isoform X2 [Erigeron canadensis]